MKKTSRIRLTLRRTTLKSLDDDLARAAGARHVGADDRNHVYVSWQVAFKCTSGPPVINVLGCDGGGFASALC